MKKTEKVLISVLIPVLTLLSVSELFSQTWTKVEGTSSYINSIFFPKGESSEVVVASDIVPTNFQDETINFYYGIGQNGFQVSTDSGKTFGQQILKDYSVYAFIQDLANSMKWFASVRQLQKGGIVSSKDNGATWDITSMNCQDYPQVVAFAAVPGDSSINYFTASVNTNNGIKSTTDTFSTCQVISSVDIQARDVKSSPLDNSLLFAAGDRGKDSIYRSTDGGKTWTGESSGIKGLRVLCLMPSGFNKAIVYCGADSVLQTSKKSVGKGIYQSLDTGKTWHCIKSTKGIRVFSLVQHPLYPRYLAAACDSQGVLMSGTYGFGWEQFNTGFSDTASVRLVGFPAWDSTSSGVMAFASAYGEGLYISKRIKTFVDGENNSDIGKINIRNIYPNPVKDKISFVWNNRNPALVRIFITDALGRQIGDAQSEYYDSGEHFGTFFPNTKFSNGLYFLNITDGLSFGREKIVVTN